MPLLFIEYIFDSTEYGYEIRITPYISGCSYPYFSMYVFNLGTFQANTYVKMVLYRILIFPRVFFELRIWARSGLVSTLAT